MLERSAPRRILGKSANSRCRIHVRRKLNFKSDAAANRLKFGEREIVALSGHFSDSVASEEISDHPRPGPPASPTMFIPDHPHPHPLASPTTCIPDHVAATCVVFHFVFFSSIECTF